MLTTGKIHPIVRLLIVCCSTQVKEDMDVESMEVALVGDTEFAHESTSRQSEHEEQSKHLVAEQEMYSKETQDATLITSTSGSPLESCAGLTTAAVVHSEAGSSSEAQEDRPEVKTKEFVMDENTVTLMENILDPSPSGPDVNEDTNSDPKEEVNTEDRIDKDTDTMEANGIQQQKQTHNKLSISTAYDLDEMMDIGTVDELDQEAQMKEEECSSLDAESSRSPGVSDAGKTKQIQL